ncbi:hypothetical protein ASD55_07825 [Rhodanobacter sp. Root561]|uniref:hypothetical protein n=1 Tax=Rhodanobacter sp. Root561 TaxID=1736560 RepID=UPI0006F5E04E|nr:hypothetical protein [Rhodanobacter sp. Root561]KQZ77757.1 hypothetical protein ASD55_07825 [Rhodanobacter sp. Root561]
MSVLAINIESGRIGPCAASDAVSIPVLGFANEPDAEMRMLRDDMARCLDPVRSILDRHGLAFEQELAVYNAIPAGLKADEIPVEVLLMAVSDAQK